MTQNNAELKIRRLLLELVEAGAHCAVEPYIGAPIAAAERWDAAQKAAAEYFRLERVTTFVQAAEVVELYAQADHDLDKREPATSALVQAGVISPIWRAPAWRSRILAWLGYERDGNAGVDHAGSTSIQEAGHVLGADLVTAIYIAKRFYLIYSADSAASKNSSADSGNPQ